MDRQSLVKKFYDEWVDKQQQIGINLRHRTILKHLKRFGLRPNHAVLEIGCGVGTVSLLIASYLKKGKLLGVDISPKSIAAAQNFLEKYPHAEFMVSDMTDFDQDLQYDFIVLPDVLEHIPFDQHPNLFRVMYKHLKPDGTLLIHIPNPQFLEWMQVHQKERLQVIDQAVHSDGLIRDAYEASFYLVHLESYRIFHHQADYQLIVMKPRKALENISLQNKYKLAIDNLKLKLFS